MTVFWASHPPRKKKTLSQSTKVLENFDCFTPDLASVAKNHSHAVRDFEFKDKSFLPLIFCAIKSPTELPDPYNQWSKVTEYDQE
jgi:hypothetical protein